MRLGLLELAVVVGLVVFAVRRLRDRRASAFDLAWVGLGIGVALLFTRAWFTAGALLTGGSFALLTLPMARAEMARRVGHPPAAGR